MSWIDNEQDHEVAQYELQSSSEFIHNFLGLNPDFEKIFGLSIQDIRSVVKVYELLGTTKESFIQAIKKGGYPILDSLVEYRNGLVLQVVSRQGVKSRMVYDPRGEWASVVALDSRHRRVILHPISHVEVEKSNILNIKSLLENSLSTLLSDLRDLVKETGEATLEELLSGYDNDLETMLAVAEKFVKEHPKITSGILLLGPAYSGKSTVYKEIYKAGVVDNNNPLIERLNDYLTLSGKGFQAVTDAIRPALTVDDLARRFLILFKSCLVGTPRHFDERLFESSLATHKLGPNSVETPIDLDNSNNGFTLRYYTIEETLRNDTSWSATSNLIFIKRSYKALSGNGLGVGDIGLGAMNIAYILSGLGIDVNTLSPNLQDVIYRITKVYLKLYWQPENIVFLDPLELPEIDPEDKDIQRRLNALKSREIHIAYYSWLKGRMKNDIEFRSALKTSNELHALKMNGARDPRKIGESILNHPIHRRFLPSLRPGALTNHCRGALMNRL